MRHPAIDRITLSGIGFTAVLVVVFASFAQAESRMQIRGAYNGKSNDLSAIDAASANGLNSVFVGIGGHLVSTDVSGPVQELSASSQLAIINEWQSKTAAAGL